LFYFFGKLPNAFEAVFIYCCILGFFALTPFIALPDVPLTDFAPLWRENDGPASAQWLLVTPKPLWFTSLAA